MNTLDAFKTSLSAFLNKFPDTPPVSGYISQNSNSLLAYNRKSVQNAELSVIYKRMMTPVRDPVRMMTV